MTIRILFVAVSIIVIIAFSSTTKVAALPMSPPLPEGIMLAGAHTPSDVEYLQENLAFMQTHLPTWYQYVIGAQPFTLWIDVRLTAGRAAEARCCDAQGRGTIKFGSKSGLSKQLEVKRALAWVDLSAYRTVLQAQIAEEDADLHSRVFWDYYCGMFE